MLRIGLVATELLLFARQQDVLGMTGTKSRRVVIEAILNILAFTSRKNQKKYLFKNIYQNISSYEQATRSWWQTSNKRSRKKLRSYARLTSPWGEAG